MKVDRIILCGACAGCDVIDIISGAALVEEQLDLGGCGEVKKEATKV